MATATPWDEDDTDVHDEVCITPLRYLNDTEEVEQRQTVIKHIKEYKGEPVPVDESFKQNWMVMETELRSIIDAGLIPADSVSSTGK